MTLDTVAMRAGGYLPEEGKDRQFAEHFRRIKRPLIDKALSGDLAAGDPRVIMVTSALPGDGKTFTSINLALSMALERDISVLLIDCDVAKRHVSDIVGLKDEDGLLDALVDESIDIESLVVQTNVRGLSILPAGRRSEATAELLSSNRMRQIVASLLRAQSAPHLAVGFAAAVDHQRRPHPGEDCRPGRAGGARRVYARGMRCRMPLDCSIRNRRAASFSIRSRLPAARATTATGHMGRTAPTEPTRPTGWRLMSLRSSTRPPPIALVLTLALASAAEADTLSYGVDAGVAQTDNVTLVSNNKVSQTIAVADADFDVKHQSRLLDVDAKGNFSYLDYLQNAYGSQLIGRFDGIAHFAIIPERVIWMLQDDFGQAALDPFAPTTPANLENVNYLSTGPDVNFRLSGTSFLNLSARYARSTYATSPYNSNRWFGSLAWGLQLSSRSSVSLNADTERVQFENTRGQQRLRPHQWFRALLDSRSPHRAVGGSWRDPNHPEWLVNFRRSCQSRIVTQDFRRRQADVHGGTPTHRREYQLQQFAERCHRHGGNRTGGAELQ